MIESSMIASIFVSGNDLDITFKKSGKTYRYAGAASHAGAIEKAESAGRYFNANIKGHFAFSQR